jgi:hypothetical protein
MLSSLLKQKRKKRGARELDFAQRVLDELDVRFLWSCAYGP